MRLGWKRQLRAMIVLLSRRSPIGWREMVGQRLLPNRGRGARQATNRLFGGTRFRCSSRRLHQMTVELKRIIKTPLGIGSLRRLKNLPRRKLCLHHVPTIFRAAAAPSSVPPARFSGYGQYSPKLS